VDGATGDVRLNWPDLVSAAKRTYDHAPRFFEYWGPPMKRAFTIAAVLALSAVAACAWKPDADQIAQSKMIGLSKKAILACMGEPVRRRSIGATDIWSFASGTVRIEGESIATFGYKRHALCNVEIVLTKGMVSQVTYTGPDGDPLDLGERCSFDVERCVSALTVRY
jgi:hypothetical protein